MRKIRSYVLDHWAAYLFILFCVIAAEICNVIYPLITKSIVNDAFLGQNLSLLWPLLIGLCLCGIGKAVFGYFKEFTADKVGATIGSEMRQEVFDHVQGLSMDYFSKTNTGELMARIKDDINNIWLAIGFIGVFLTEVVLHVTFLLICMFTISWKLTLIPLAIMSVSGATAIILEKKLDQVYEEISEENAVLTTVAEENLAGVRTVKAFARERYEIDKFLGHNKKYYDLNVKEAKILAKFDPVFSFVAVLMPVVCTVLGGIEVIRGNMDLGSLIAYAEYSRNITWPMEVLGWIVNCVSSAFASRKKIVAILGEKPSIAEPENPTVLSEVKGKVEFDHVSFGIDEDQILTDVSFTLEPGQTLGIMGATGSGKSTIVNLLQRFYDVNDGSVKFDDVDVKELSFEQLRGNISVVTQDVFLFSDTISENIRMGQRAALSNSSIEKACQLAQASEFVEDMEDKYETIIGERGVGLSGGQKQRISIARAFAKEAPLLVLDDSTSALDMETEKKIQRTLSQMDGTKLIIAHRISAVRHADEIIYLENGHVAERGRHEDLMAKKGLYYNTYIAQYGSEVI